MAANFKRIIVSDVELSSFVTAVKTRFGIDFGNYEKKSLKRGLARLMMKNQVESIMTLWGKMLRDKSMLYRYVDELLVNLTEFFRNAEFWVKYKDSVLPILAAKKEIKVWHAGCSTGEEVYTNKIVFKESFMMHKLHIWATDLSSKALAKAMEGAYHKLSWSKYIKAYAKYNPKGKAERYFTEEEKRFVIQSQLKKNISFEKHNLVQDAIEDSFDVIFCRNVMIYFDDVLKMKVLRSFHQHLKKDGFLIIGYYDMLPEEAKGYYELFCASTRIYRKI